jgi:hypothetical protein
MPSRPSEPTPRPRSSPDGTSTTRRRGAGKPGAAPAPEGWRPSPLLVIAGLAVLILVGAELYRRQPAPPPVTTAAVEVSAPAPEAPAPERVPVEPVTSIVPDPVPVMLAPDGKPIPD